MNNQKLKKTNERQTAENIGNLQIEEERRRHSDEQADAKMSDAEYRDSLHSRYGESRWADHLVDDLARKHHEEGTEHDAEQPTERASK